MAVAAAVNPKSPPKAIKVAAKATRVVVRVERVPKVDLPRAVAASIRVAKARVAKEAKTAMVVVVEAMMITVVVVMDTMLKEAARRRDDEDG